MQREIPFESIAYLSDVPTSWEQTKQICTWTELNELTNLKLEDIWDI
jgi:hypothetical protein